jgi:hypothetical protein
MYNHRLFRINYTTYDIRREQDVVNPGTSHCNIMLLAEQASGVHPFLYARVLGIYHANVIYVGPGMVDYNPMRFEFLWIRWYQLREPACGPLRNGQESYALDQLSFLPVTNPEAFGFVDPADVLRSCHILPRFAGGRRYPNSQNQDSDDIGLSRCARDRQDWNSYYVGRYVAPLTSSTETA